MKKITVSILALALCAALLSTAALASDFGEADDATRATVFLINTDNDGNPVICSGVIISITSSRTYVLSDLSCSMNMATSGTYATPPNVVYCLAITEDTVQADEMAAATIEWVDQQLNVVIYSTPTLPGVADNTMARLGTSDQLYEGLAANYLGIYLESIDASEAEIAYVESAVMETDDGEGAFVLEDYPNESNFFYAGGPVVTDDGVVLGVAMSQLDSNGWRVVAPMDKVINWLRNNGLPFNEGYVEGYTPPPSEEPEPSRDPVDDPGRDPVTDPTRDPVTGPTTPDPEKKGGGGLLYVLIAVVAVVAGVAVFLVKRGKKASAAAAPPTGVPGVTFTRSPAEGATMGVPHTSTVSQAPISQAPISQTPISQAPAGGTVQITPPSPTYGESKTVPMGGLGGLSLEAVGGVMNGSVFPLMGNSVTIGRRPDQCAVIFPDGTPGISGVHCRLDFANGVYTLTDLGSSNGTFINGQRLAPNVPTALTPGTVFCVGGPFNSFKLKEG